MYAYGIVKYEYGIMLTHLNGQKERYQESLGYVEAHNLAEDLNADPTLVGEFTVIRRELSKWEDYAGE